MYRKDHLHKTEGLGLTAVTAGGALELFLMPHPGSRRSRTRPSSLHAADQAG